MDIVLFSFTLLEGEITTGCVVMFDYSSLSVEWSLAILRLEVGRGEEVHCMGLRDILGFCRLVQAAFFFVLYVFLLFVFEGTTFNSGVEKTFEIGEYG